LNKIIKSNPFIYKGREHPLELRLLQFFVCAEEVWLIFNALTSVAGHMPVEMVRMYIISAIFLPSYLLVFHFLGLEKISIELYYVIYFVTIPIIWRFAGGNEASANVLFVCELVLFTMCLNGKKQKVFLVLSILSSSAIQVLSHIVPFLIPLALSDSEKAMASRNLGLSTSLLIVSLLLKQKKEYAKERDAAVKSEKELEKSNQLQKNFLANMSHEIRSPLGIVLGFNELISETDDIGQIHEYASNIEKAGKTLHTVINDILDYSKIESGKLDIIDEDYSFDELISEVKEDIKLKSSEKGLKFIVEKDETIPSMLYGDTIRIKQCLLNLLSNAVKYTDQGTVTLKIVRLEDEREDYCTIRFDVTDTGRGMSSETIPKLFDAFQRLDEGYNRGIEGTGLGLAITKDLLDEMNGSISVESEYGKGSTFTIILGQKISDKEIAIHAKDSEKISLEGVKILAVDDTKMNLTLIAKLLGKENAIVKSIDNGAECLEDCKINKYDVILLDHMMPEMDGVQVFNLLRESDGLNKETPVIMLTANAMAGAGKEYEELGFDGYVSKPIKVQSLREEVIKCLNKK